MTPDGPAAPGASPARIVDQGYRRYDGPRRGPAGATRAVYTSSLRRALGLRRGARHKIVPVVTAALAYLPAIVFVGVAALLPAQVQDAFPSYSDYYGFVTAAIVLFVAFVAPEVLCGDRRTGMLGLYLSGPLTRDRYLVAKAGAVATVLGVVTLGPVLLLLVGKMLADAGPGSVGATLGVFVRIVASAAVVTTWYTALSLAVSSLTDRRSFASAGIILWVLVSAAVVGALVNGAGLTPWLRLLDVFDLPFELVRRIYGERLAVDVEPLGTGVLAVGAMAWVVAAVVTLRTRYQRLEVTR